jgi:PRTRC genetic system protein C
MSITIKTLPRTFRFGSITLNDPDPVMSVDEVKLFYSHQYPEMATATVLAGRVVGEKIEHVIQASYGSKG